LPAPLGPTMARPAAGGRQRDVVQDRWPCRTVNRCTAQATRAGRNGMRATPFTCAGSVSPKRGKAPSDSGGSSRSPVHQPQQVAAAQHARSARPRAAPAARSARAPAMSAAISSRPPMAASLSSTRRPCVVLTMRPHQVRRGQADKGDQPGLRHGVPVARASTPPAARARASGRPRLCAVASPRPARPARAPAPRPRGSSGASNTAAMTRRNRPAHKAGAAQREALHGLQHVGHGQRAPGRARRPAP
jgi:hypothetical protein